MTITVRPIQRNDYFLNIGEVLNFRCIESTTATTTPTTKTSASSSSSSSSSISYEDFSYFVGCVELNVYQQIHVAVINDRIVGSGSVVFELHPSGLRSRITIDTSSEVSLRVKQQVIQSKADTYHC